MAYCVAENANHANFASKALIARNLITGKKSDSKKHSWTSHKSVRAKFCLAHGAALKC